MRTALLASLATVSLLCVCPKPAYACWDGFYVRADRVTFTGSGDTDWSAAGVRELATWTRRFQVLLGGEATLEADMGYGELCRGARCEEVVARSTQPQPLFAAVAAALQLPWRQRAAALVVTAAPYAVQVAAVRERAQAETLAARLSELDLPMGFVEIGGFPSDNPEAHVIEAADADGRAVYRVVVGAFLDRREAAGHAAEIAQRTGLPTLLRAL